MKIKFWEDSNGDQSVGRLVFFIGSIWNMFIATLGVIHGIPPMITAGAWSSIQTLLSGYILIHKNIENNNKEKAE